MGESGWRQDGHPVGPGLTPEVCPLLWAGASEGTPLEPRGGAGDGRAPGRTPTAAELWTELGVGGRPWATVLWIAFLSVGFSFFFLILIFFFPNRNTSLFNFYFLFHVIVLSFCFFF